MQALSGGSGREMRRWDKNGCDVTRYVEYGRKEKKRNSVRWWKHRGQKEWFRARKS